VFENYIHSLKTSLILFVIIGGMLLNWLQLHYTQHFFLMDVATNVWLFIEF
jgi:hypothetical protein